MSDAWLDLLRLCVMGAVGLGAAWLGGQMDLSIYSRYRLRLEEESDSADPKSQVRLNETIERASAAMTEVQRVNATHPKTGRGEAHARYAAVQTARRIVEATAKRHLRL